MRIRIGLASIFCGFCQLVLPVQAAGTPAPLPADGALLEDLEDARRVLGEIEATRGKHLEIERLQGGLTNRAFRIVVSGQAYALRLPGADTELLGVDRRTEMLCTLAAASTGIGAPVVEIIPERGIQLMRWVEGRPLGIEDVRPPETLERIAAALRRCHSAPISEEAGEFSAFDTVRGYVASARAEGVSLPMQMGVALDLLALIREEVSGADTPCLCHNDLLPANFIDTGSEVRIIDWEYAGRGDRFFDLGNFAVNFQLDPASERLLLESYFGELKPGHHRRLRLMRLVSDMREATWGFLQAGISELNTPAYYLEYGRKHLERFIESAEAEGLALPSTASTEEKPR